MCAFSKSPDQPARADVSLLKLKNPSACEPNAMPFCSTVYSVRLAPVPRTRMSEIGPLFERLKNPMTLSTLACDHTASPTATPPLGRGAPPSPLFALLDTDAA